MQLHRTQHWPVCAFGVLCTLRDMVLLRREHGHFRREQRSRSPTGVVTLLSIESSHAFLGQPR